MLHIWVIGHLLQKFLSVRTGRQTHTPVRVVYLDDYSRLVQYHVQILIVAFHTYSVFFRCTECNNQPMGPMTYLRVARMSFMWLKYVRWLHNYSSSHGCAILPNKEIVDSRLRLRFVAGPGESLSRRPTCVVFASPIICKHDVIHKTGST